MIALAPRCTCAVCGLYAEAARPKSRLCRHCAADPASATALLDARVAAALRRSESAWLHLNRCVDELGELAERWERLRQALTEDALLCADAETRRRLDIARRAAEEGDTARLPAPLATCLQAFEAHYWASDAYQRAHLQASIGALALTDETILQGAA